MNKNTFRLIVLTFPIVLASCSVRDGAPERYTRDWRSIEDAIPLDEPFSRYGNPDSYEVYGKQYRVMSDNTGFSEKGLASWYGTKFHGQRTSSGETYDMYEMTAAHKSLRIPSYVEVVNLKNNRRAIVKVNDRGPFHEGRIIDLSYAAATKLGVAESGTAPVSIRVVEAQKPKPGIDNNSVTEVSEKKVRDTKPAKQQSGKVVNDHFYVQVAVFSNEGNALAMLKNLKAGKFKNARIHVENNKSDLLYRVRIGPLATMLLAKKTVTKLKEINHDNVKIVALTIN